jgi:nucleotide-binding universal stress UspA family protein
MRVRRILAPVDFSDVSNQALEAAAGLAKQLGSKLVVLHAVEPVYFAGTMFGPEINVPQLVEEQRRAAASAIEDILNRLERREIDATGLVQTGVPHEVILRIADEKKCDLIVVGTHGRSGVSHFLLGSVAEKVVRAAKCPVMTLRGSESKPKAKTTKKRAAKKKA